MKKIITLVLITVNIVVYAQNNTIDAFEKSYTYEYQANYSKAITVLEALNSENSYSINLRLGWLYYMNTDYMKSKIYYEKAINLKNSSIEAKLGLIYPLSAMKNWDAVIAAYKAIITIDNNHTSSHYQLAYIYLLRKKYTEAELHLKNVLKLYPFDFNANALLGSVYVKLGKIKEAKLHYTTALEYNPSSTEIKNIMKGL